MAWFKKDKTPKEMPIEKKIKIPEGLWIKCNSCKEIIFRKEVDNNHKVCPKCGYHFPISVEERIAQLIDEGTFKEFDSTLASKDPLEFKDSVKYRHRLKNNQRKTGYNDAMITGTGSIGGHLAVLGVLNFRFMGGSMGSVVGEKVARAVDKAVEDKAPLIIIIASGGARMQEGILSLMQMPRTAVALDMLREERLPYIVVLTDPTTGGVTASYAMMGDVHFAEPGALIGFAGPRVIENTIREKLPEGFQRSEYLLDHGMVDKVVERKDLRDNLIQVISLFSPQNKSASKTPAHV